MIPLLVRGIVGVGLDPHKGGHYMSEGLWVSSMNSSLLELFQQLGVVSNGHFVLSSGQHSDEYWEKFRLLEWPRVTEQLCREIALRYEELAISAVIGPTTGGAMLAQEVARQLNSRCLLAEPASKGGRELRRGFV